MDDCKILVSVIMSVYNEEESFLKEAIDSICNQTYDNIEFIIFDDCSTNISTINTLKKYAEMDDRIVLVKNSENKGLTQNLHDGVLIAKGKYICRQDSDDISLPTRIEKQVEYLEENTDICVVCTAFYVKNGKKIKKHSIGYKSPEGIKACLLIENSHIMHGSVMIRKFFLNENNINYDPYYKKTQDYDLWTRVTEIGKIAILPLYLCIYRISEKQISTNIITASEQRKFYKEIITRQISKYYPDIDEEQMKAHLSLTMGTPDSRFSEVMRWSIKILRKEEIRRQYSIKYLAPVVLKRLFSFASKVIKNEFR